MPILLALGGGSYPKTGSDASWTDYFKKSNISVSPLKPMNCGFEVSWSNNIKNKNLPVPVKNIVLLFNKKTVRGEMMMTHYGLEGGFIYSISREIREYIENNGYADIHIDLFSDLTIEQLENKTNKERVKKSLSSCIKNCMNVSAVKIDLIRECISKTEYFNILSTPELFKNLPLRLIKPRPLSEAISSSGGLEFAELNNSLMLKKSLACGVPVKCLTGMPQLEAI